MMLVRVRRGGRTHAALPALPVFLGAALLACGSSSPNTLLSGGAGGWGGGDPGTSPSSSGPPSSGTSSGSSGAGGTGSGAASSPGSSGGTGTSSSSTGSGTSGGTATSSSSSGGASSGGASGGSGTSGSSGTIGASGSGGLGSGSGGSSPDASVSDAEAGDGGLAGEPFTFTLIDTSIVATNGSPIPRFDPIPNGATIDLAAVGNTLSIRANVDPTDVAAVEFYLDVRFHHTESGAPYMLCSNNGPTINDCNLGTGAHVLESTVFYQAVQGTTTGPTSTLAFVIVDSSADAAAD